MGYSQNLTSDLIRHSMLDILLSGFGLDLAIYQKLNQTLCVSYFTQSILGSFNNWPVIKSDTIC